MTCFRYIYPIVPWDLKTCILEREGGKILGIDHHPAPQGHEVQIEGFEGKCAFCLCQTLLEMAIWLFYVWPSLAIKLRGVVKKRSFLRQADCKQTWYLWRIIFVQKKLSCGEISAFHVWQLWGNWRFLHMWRNFRCLHMTEEKWRSLKLST